MLSIVVTNNPKDWDLNIKGAEVVSAKQYFTDSRYAQITDARVFNICRSYKYQSTGYYISLIAEARGNRVFPNVSTIQDLKSQTILQSISEEIDELMQKSLKKIQSKDFVLSVYFGKNMAKQYWKLSKHIFNLFQAPLLRAHFIYNKKWLLQSIQLLSLKYIPETHKPYVIEFANEYFAKKRIKSPKSRKPLYDLAILVNPDEKYPPSNKIAIKKFIKAAESIGLNTDLITKDDFSRIAEYDALFIRETTAVNHHTYRLARKAVAEGLAVLDDPVSILKCSNKVFLAELLAKAKIPAPKTLIVHKDNKDEVIKNLGLPCILKQPDGAFSKGVIKADDKETLQTQLGILLEISDLVIAQEFKPTEFDWRVGICNREPLFACKYFMAQGHWQIYNWQTSKSDSTGEVETVPIPKVPEHVLNTAIKAANLIGDGIYGVDLKEIGNKAYVIEVNDNPNVDHGYEDKILKDKLYLKIMKVLLERLKLAKKRVEW